MSRTPRKCLRKCTGCGREMITTVTNHKIRIDGKRIQCGIFRVNDKK